MDAQRVRNERLRIEVEQLQQRFPKLVDMEPLRRQIVEQAAVVDALDRSDLAIQVLISRLDHLPQGVSLIEFSARSAQGGGSASLRGETVDPGLVGALAGKFSVSMPDARVELFPPGAQSTFHTFEIAGTVAPPAEGRPCSACCCPWRSQWW